MSKRFRNKFERSERDSARHRFSLSRRRSRTFRRPEGGCRAMLPGGSAALGERTDPWTSLISKCRKAAIVRRSPPAVARIATRREPFEEKQAQKAAFSL